MSPVRDHQAEVTVCIPAWQAEPFIDRTLRCAREQTHRLLRIVVSVDLSDDATVDICRRHAQEDRRIEVLVQNERIGWTRNANLLLDRVQSEFFQLYFHDDILEPQCIERLLARLQEREDAAAAYCDVGHFGERNDVLAGPDYEGSRAERLSLFFLSMQRGAPLRCLTRQSVVGTALRFPTDAPDGFLANEPYLAELIAAGPVLRVPEVLYRRWVLREGGLTHGWRSLTRPQVVAGLLGTTESLLRVVEAGAANADERALLGFALTAFMMNRLSARHGGTDEPPIEPDEIGLALAPLQLSRGLSRFSPEVRKRVKRALAKFDASQRPPSRHGA